MQHDGQSRLSSTADHLPFYEAEDGSVIFRKTHAPSPRGEHQAKKTRRCRRRRVWGSGSLRLLQDHQEEDCDENDWDLPNPATSSGAVCGFHNPPMWEADSFEFVARNHKTSPSDYFTLHTNSSILSQPSPKIFADFPNFSNPQEISKSPIPSFQFDEAAAEFLMSQRITGLFGQTICCSDAPNSDSSYPNSDSSYPNSDSSYPNSDSSYPNSRPSTPSLSLDGGEESASAKVTQTSELSNSSSVLATHPEFFSSDGSSPRHRDETSIEANLMRKVPRLEFETSSVGASSYCQDGEWNPPTKAAKWALQSSPFDAQGAAILETREDAPSLKSRPPSLLASLLGDIPNTDATFVPNLANHSNSLTRPDVSQPQSGISNHSDDFRIGVCSTHYNGPRDESGIPVGCVPPFALKSGVQGVSWNKRMKAWLAFWRERDRRHSKTFRATVMGFEEARVAAIHFLQVKLDELADIQRPPRDFAIRLDEGTTACSAAWRASAARFVCFEEFERDTFCDDEAPMLQRLWSSCVAG